MAKIFIVSHKCHHPIGTLSQNNQRSPLYEGLSLYSKNSFRARIDVTSAQVSLRWKKQILSLSSRTIHDFTKGLNDVSLERFNIIVPHCCEHCNQHMSDDSRPGPIMFSYSWARHITVTMSLSTQEHEWLNTIRSAYSDEELQFFMSLHSRETEKSYGNYELKLTNLNLLSFQKELRS